MPESYKRAIHWFRRDLRTTDNTALNEAASAASEVIPLYILSNWKTTHRWTGPNRQEFLLDCLQSLDANLRALGSQLIIRSTPPLETFEQIIQSHQIEALYLNRVPDPHGKNIELSLARKCKEWGVNLHTFSDATLHEPDEVLTQQGSPYRIFTPYFRAWSTLPKTQARKRPAYINTPHHIQSDPLPNLSHWHLSSTISPKHRLPGGEKAARNRLTHALNHIIPHYAEKRDVPTNQTTSRLSQDLRFGLLSIREIHSKTLALTADNPNPHSRNGAHTFISQLAWREFYMQILHHYPEVMDCEFNPDFRDLPWENNELSLTAWQQGRTGFPLVDAGMRQLNATGFMHNRLRMITAMFLTKDLHIDWRLGEQYFMQKLIDGEIASNNGGWQWSAGTGADAAPYFRIQNPWTQTKRHDPNGTFIKQWIPELAKADPKQLIQPPDNNRPIADHYPAPIVDHARERQRTLNIFASHKQLRRQQKE